MECLTRRQLYDPLWESLYINKLAKPALGFHYLLSVSEMDTIKIEMYHH